MVGRRLRGFGVERVLGWVFDNQDREGEIAQDGRIKPCFLWWGAYGGSGV